MDRLTQIIDGQLCTVINTGETVQYRYGDDIDKLAAYEDTGLTPEEITAMKADNERLHRLLDQTEEIVQSAVSTPKNRDGVYCKDCDYFNTDSGKSYCCHSNMSTNGLDDWCYHGIKRKEQE